MNIKKLLIALLLFGSTGTILAQVHNKGILFVANSGELYTKGIYSFGDGSATIKTKTTRATNNGLVSMAANAVTLTGDAATNFVDGFVKIIPSSTAGFYKSPVGFDNNYGPIGFNTTNSFPVVNAYFRANPTSVGSTIDVTEIAALSAKEFWKVASSNSAKVTLYWNSFSDISTILGSKSIDYLTIAGFDGTQWIAINTTINTGSNTAVGSMITAANVSLNSFTHYAIGSRKDLACYPPITSSGPTGVKTYSAGIWSPSEPTIADKVIINSILTIVAGNPINCYEIEQNADIIMGDGAKLTVVNGFTVAANKKIVMTNLASVLQQNPNAEAPFIEMTRIAKQMRRYDYVFISSPLASTSDFFSQILNKNNVAVNGSYGTESNSAYQQLRTFNDAGLVAIDATIDNTPKGRGFSSTVRNQTPYSTVNTIVSGQPVPWASQKFDISIKAVGKTNNGSYTLDLPTSVGGYTRLGNPYPGPIDLRQIFKATDGQLEKTAYYWTYHTPRSNITTNAATYTSSDFSTFNLTAAVSAYPGLEPIPDGIILPLQSVLVRTVGAGPAIIDNCVRTPLPAPPSGKNLNSSVNGKFRLNLIGSENSYSQIVVAYNGETGTQGFDNGYDSSRLAGLTSEISTIMNDTRYVIETRPSFTIGDVVPLQLDKRTNETFTISLTDTQGVFNSTSVLLHDKTEGIYHDLSINDYSFVQNNASDVQRFEIVYQNTILDNGDFQVKNAFAFITKGQFRAQSNSTISEISIYDIAGRLIITYSNVNAQGFSSSFDKAQGVYIAKIKLADGTIVNQKLINN